MRSLISALAVALLCAALPATVAAQGVIAGVVADRSGAPIAGVVVEASSPVLIEKARTTVTDSSGRYRIENLLPGVYSLTLTIGGWRGYEETGLELAGSRTVRVDAELTVGTLTSQVKVTRQLPGVDPHTVTQELPVPADLIRSIPSARSYNALLPLIPGVVTSSNDTVTGAGTTSFPIHGGRTNEGRLLVDGFNVGSPPSGNSATTYSIDTGRALEVTFRTSSVSGESETAGLVMNVVPRSGGNQWQASVFTGASAEPLQSDNVTPSQAAAGVTASPFRRLYDVSGTIGGPVLRDRLWYFATGQVSGTLKDTPNIYYNLETGNGASWLYQPDLSRPAYSDRTIEAVSGRLTWQASRRHKFTGFVDTQQLCRTCTGATPGLSEPPRISPEAVGVLGRGLTVSQVTWSAPLTTRLMLDAGYAGTYFGVGNFEREPNPTRDLIRVAEQCTRGCAANGSIPGLVYRSQDYSVAHTGSFLWKGAVTYIAGAHSMKAGYQQTLMTDDRTWFTNGQNLTYRLDDGVPNQLTESISPWVNDARVSWQGLFAQDRWTRNRVTIEGAARFDRAWSWFPKQQEGPSRFLPVPIVVARTKGVDSYKDVTIRGGAAYDLLGTGRTVLRVSLGKFLEGAGVTGNYANTNPTLRMPQTTPVFGTAGVSRAWSDANGNFVPDCDLLNPGLQDLRPAGGDMCGVMSNTRFGSSALTNTFDPAILNGWGVRPSDWQLIVAVEHEIAPRSSLSVSYVRRWYNGFFVVDNQSLSPADLIPFSIVAPADRRLPGGGGYVIAGLNDVVPQKAGQVDNLVTDSSEYGSWSQYFNGIDVTFSVRDLRGVTLSGGTSTGQTVADNCEVRANLPELSTTTTGTSAFGPGLSTATVTPASPYCHVAFGLLTQLRGFASYVLPGTGIQLAGTVQSKPGSMLSAVYAVPSAAAAESLGRPLSGNAANVSVNLIEPGTMFGGRINQFDLRVGRSFGYRGTRTLVAGEVYNVLNSSAPLAYNSTFVPGGSWPAPLAILSPRLLRITLEVDF
jgi:hypothetical protein